MQNTIQGHLHTQAYIQHYCGRNFRIYGAQIGCGIDSFSYAKAGRKPAIGCMVVLDQGQLPISLLMKLGAK